MKERELLYACKKCDLKTVQTLLNVSSKQSKNSSKTYDDQSDRAKEIIQLTHIDVNCRESKFQMTPLIIASVRGSKDIVSALVSHGANVHLRDVKGNTALQLACMKQRFHVIHILLKNGSNVNDINGFGWNSLISAVSYFHEDNAIMLLMLLQNGVKSEHKDKNGLMAIDHAVKKRKYNSIKVILNYNPKLAQSCSRALVNASIKGYFDIVLLLLNFGVNPNKIDIITGTGPLHEAVRYNDIRDDKNRDVRLKIVQYLAKYGADPELPNTAGETPMKIVVMKNDRFTEHYINALKLFYKKPHKMPKFINPNARTINELTETPMYPLLRPRLNWTRNDFRYCTQQKNLNPSLNPVTNLLDGDLQSMWTVDSSSFVWVIFDLKGDHTITRIRLYAWKSKEMPSECFLQVSNSMEGPWNNVQNFKCTITGSNNRDAPGVPLDFDGFNVTSRYWRLVIAKNYGSTQTSFHGIEFYGYDNRVFKMINKLNYPEYEDVFVENDLNQIEAIVNCTEEQFNSLPIHNDQDRQRLWDFILELKRRVMPLKKLEWFLPPTAHCLVDERVPAFSVTSSSFLADTLQLLCHGGATINGDVIVDLEPDGMDDPSMAIFNNITFSQPGKFLLEIRSVADPTVYLSAPHPITVYAHNDPNYPGIDSPRPQNIPKLRRYQTNDNDFSDDDSDLANIYDFPDDFSSRQSHLKINKWLTKGNSAKQQFVHHDNLNEDDDQYDDENSFGAPKRREMYFNTSNMNEDLIRHNARDIAGRQNKSPPIIVNGNHTHYTNGHDSSYSSAFRSKIQHNNAPVPQHKNTKASVNTQTVEPRPQPPKKVEYEVQSFTVDFIDEPYPTLDRKSFARNAKDFYDSQPVTQPKTEARVFVNNLSYDLPSDVAKNDPNAERYYYGLRRNSILNNSQDNRRVVSLSSSQDSNRNAVYQTDFNRPSIDNKTEQQPINVAVQQQPAPISQQRRISNVAQLQNALFPNIAPPNQFKSVPPPPPPPVVPLLNLSKSTSANIPPVPPPPPPPSMPNFASEQSAQIPQQIHKKLLKQHNSEKLDYKSTGTLKNTSVEVIEITNEHMESHVLAPNIADPHSDTLLLPQRYVRQQQTPSNNQSSTRHVKFNSTDLIQRNQNRETPSPCTIDRIVDEAFDHISNDEEEEEEEENNMDMVDENEDDEGDEAGDGGDAGNNFTFTNIAKQKIQEYLKVKRDSLSNSSDNSIGGDNGPDARINKSPMLKRNSN